MYTDFGVLTENRTELNDKNNKVKSRTGNTNTTIAINAFDTNTNFSM